MSRAGLPRRDRFGHRIDDLETLDNPKPDGPDFQVIAALASEAGLPLLGGDTLPSSPTC